jgi:hypothetical protein
MTEGCSVSMRGVGLGTDPSRSLRMTMRGNEGKKMDARLKMSGMTAGRKMDPRLLMSGMTGRKMDAR